MTFQLSPTSISHLVGVHPALISVVKQALTISSYDFSIICGLRTEQDEAECVASGHSETMHSRHLAGPDGKGRAVDFMAFVDGVGTWQPQYYVAVADAFRLAGVQLSIRLGWGAAWSMSLNDAVSAQDLHNQYVAQEQATGQRAFDDWGHIELDRHVYP